MEKQPRILTVLYNDEDNTVIAEMETGLWEVAEMNLEELKNIWKKGIEIEKGLEDNLENSTEDYDGRDNKNEDSNIEAAG